MREASRGQVLVGAVLVLLIAAILVPLLVFYSRREAVWTQSQAEKTTAFHLAEAGIEKAYMAMTVSTQTWENIQAGKLLSGYQLDTSYTDLSGGEYAISITSGPESQEATVLSVGRDDLDREVRAIEAVYANSVLSGTALYGGGSVEISGGVNVEWGGIMSPQPITLGSSVGYPQFWSASSITPFDSDPSPPNCDSPSCCQWHSYSSDIPPAPSLDFASYKSSAEAEVPCPVSGGVGGSCYFDTDQTWKNITDTSGDSYYIDNGHSLTIGSPGIYIVGSIIITGNLNLPNGTFGKGSPTMDIPPLAWKQYCNDWSHYQSFDGGAPASFPGLDSGYHPSGLTYPGSKIAFNGLVYVGGILNGGGGGGNGNIYGAFYVVGTTTMTWNSGVTVYYNDGAAQNIMTTGVQLSRQSWQEKVMSWPSGLP
ncbi:MAG: hypothetical protein KGL04_01410 [Elusimicrobia bacterium]|nr:hypothetical protein [Elusimicrobiota bacterium]